MPSPYRIAIANEQTVLKLDRTDLRRVVRTTLRAEEIASAELSLAFVDNARIHEVNRQFLGHDYPTDVISFGYDDAERDVAAESRPAGRHVAGELIVSAEMAAERCTEYDWSAGEELALYVVHGLLHLVGYDDHGSAAQKKMRAREREILDLLLVSPRRERE